MYSGIPSFSFSTKTSQDTNSSTSSTLSCNLWRMKNWSSFSMIATMALPHVFLAETGDSCYGSIARTKSRMVSQRKKRGTELPVNEDKALQSRLSKNSNKSDASNTQKFRRMRGAGKISFASGLLAEWQSREILSLSYTIHGETVEDIPNAKHTNPSPSNPNYTLNPST